MSPTLIVYASRKSAGENYVDIYYLPVPEIRVRHEMLREFWYIDVLMCMMVKFTLFLIAVEADGRM